LQIKLTKGLTIYFSINRIIGLFIVMLAQIGNIYYALFIDGASGGFGSFVSWSATFSVLLIGLSITYMKKHVIQENEMGLMLRKDQTLAGWIVFMINIMFIGYGMNSQEGRDLVNIGPELSNAILPIIYGYMHGIIMESYFTKDQK